MVGGVQQQQREPATRRKAAKAATRAKLLAGAERLFEQLGYEAVTIRLIAREVGMSTGAVFAHFKDKAELYQTIYGHGPVSPEVGRKLLRLGALFLKVGMTCNTREQLERLIRRAGSVDVATVEQ